MRITYIHHSGFLVETERFYYLFDYETGSLPAMNARKPIFVLSSHSHGDHYNPKVFTLLKEAGMRHIAAVLSDDIEAPSSIPVLSVGPEKEYSLGEDLYLTTLRSTDLGVAFLIADQGQLIYHAGDLNDWVWDEETEEYNEEMTRNYRRQIGLLAEKLRGRKIDTAFVVLDPRQERDYARGMCYFLENIPADTVYPMHYWDDPGIIDTFLSEYPHYSANIRRTESK